MSKPEVLNGLVVEPVVVGSAREFVDAPRDAKTVSYLASVTLQDVDRFAAELGAKPGRTPPPDWRRLVAAVSIGPVIAVCDQPVATAIGWLPAHPWLSHVVSTSMLETELGKDHLANTVALSIAHEPRLLDWLEPADSARRVRI